jgi:hypothetical protein
MSVDGVANQQILRPLAVPPQRKSDRENDGPDRAQHAKKQETVREPRIRKPDIQHAYASNLLNNRTKPNQPACGLGLFVLRHQPFGEDEHKDGADQRRRDELIQSLAAHGL